ncbi:bifunctional diguanylate cyclase/phosphodiesterase [uncultured Massilia sp.]|uniref:putative bifunctional diguanylate cyclase/phosphodiesterase n=1 Tax=uncultured Massilia sp. TaxID=169973 RepID=UPI002588253D|nr:EAL domain-containing protein [uncultured Massilia sp.]
MLDFDDLAAWRMRIFTSLMSIVLVFAFCTAVPSAALALFRGRADVALMDALALVWILAIWRFDALSYTARVLNFLAMLFVIGVASMMMVGAIGLCYLVAPPILAVILLGMRPAFVALGVSAGCMMVLGLAGHSELSVSNLPHDSFLGVSIFVLNFTCVVGFVTLACGRLLKGLSRSLDDVQGFAESLEERQASLHAVNSDLNLTSAALAGLNDMVVIVNAVQGEGANPVMFANAAFEHRSGYTAREIIGTSLRCLYGPDTDRATVARIAAAMARCEGTKEQLVLYTRAGLPRWIEVDMVPFSSEGGAISHWVIVGHDVTEQRHASEAIHRLAFYDVLTGLPNRRLLTERLDAMLARARGARGFGCILYIDLDNFKAVNDARGHATGDLMLKCVAERLRAAVRPTDTVARLGGDEFVVLLEDLGRDCVGAAALARSMAEQVRSSLALPVEIEGQAYRSSGSIGMALPTRPEHSAHDLLREADTAMYQAKAAGRNGIALFESAMLVAAEEALTLERDLATAVERGELALHLQLQVDSDERPVGAEALLRWRRGGVTPVGPDVFIPLAESTGLIVPIGAWVLREACLAWHELARAGHALPLSINVSPRQFGDPGFVAGVRATLLETGVSPHDIMLEVTEGLLVDDLEQTAVNMRELAALGVRFSIDDFGTGYSNLAYLSKMPLHELKIDRSLISGLPGDANAVAIVHSILAMASHLGLRVMAEGIETAAQARFLASHGAPCMQGYLFCRPMSVAQLLSLLDARLEAPESLEALPA